jgi:hypothetical protein
VNLSKGSDGEQRPGEVRMPHGDDDREKRTGKKKTRAVEVTAKARRSSKARQDRCLVKVVKRSGGGTRESSPEEEKKKEGEQEQKGGRAGGHRQLPSEERNRFPLSWPNPLANTVTATTGVRAAGTLALFTRAHHHSAPVSARFVYLGEVILLAMKVWHLGEIGGDKRVLRWLNTFVRVGDLYNTESPVLTVSNQNHRD